MADHTNEHGERLLISPAEAARILSLDQVSQTPERLIRDMARRGELRHVRVGRWMMIDKKSVELRAGVR